MSHKPKWITFSGVDDNVNVADLELFSKRFSTIEWGVLYCPEKEGTARHPSAVWRTSFIDHGFASSCLHLCGEQVFRNVLDSRRRESVLRHAKRYRRVQADINFKRRAFTDDQVLGVYLLLLENDTTLVVRYDAESHNVIVRLFDRIGRLHSDKVHVLFDMPPSHGRKPLPWPSPLIYDTLYGYAGNIGPGSVAQQLERIHEAFGEDFSNYWLDVESGVRTGNQFDHYKVTAVMNAVYD